jgi:hypothetical protein
MRQIFERWRAQCGAATARWGQPLAVLCWAVGAPIYALSAHEMGLFAEHLDEPAPGHPERLLPLQAPSPEEQALWAQLSPQLHPGL